MDTAVCVHNTRQNMSLSGLDRQGHLRQFSTGYVEEPKQLHAYSEYQRRYLVLINKDSPVHSTTTLLLHELVF